MGTQVRVRNEGRRREVVHPPPVPVEKVQVRSRHHHRSGVRIQTYPSERKANKIANLGHCNTTHYSGRTIDFQVHYKILLQGIHWRHPRLRHHQQGVLPEYQQVARRNQELLQRQNHPHAHRQQNRSRLQVMPMIKKTSSLLRRGIHPGKEERHALHGVLSQIRPKH